MNAVHFSHSLGFLLSEQCGGKGRMGKEVKNHTMVIMPNPIVINENTNLGPHILTQSVAGNWNVTLATVYTKIDTDYINYFISMSRQLN